jgi:hypothetical protein
MKQIKGKLVVYGDHVYQIKSATMNNVVLHGLNKGAGEATFIRSIFDGKVSRGEISYIEKMYFDIDVTKVSRSTHTIRVEATNLEEAKDKAFNHNDIYLFLISHRYSFLAASDAKQNM